MYHTLFFDLDNTLYPKNSGLWEAIGARINLYLQDFMKMAPEEIANFREYCHKNYGTTLQGLKNTMEVDEDHYLSFVHDVELSKFLDKDKHVANTLESLPQRKIVFTNSDKKHAGRVLQYLEINHLFDQTIDVQMTEPYVKPHQKSYKKALELAGYQSSEGCVFIDDMLPNVVSADELGFFSILIGDDENSDYPHQIDDIDQLPELLNGHSK